LSEERVRCPAKCILAKPTKVNQKAQRKCLAPVEGDEHLAEVDILELLGLVSAWGPLTDQGVEVVGPILKPKIEHEAGFRQTEGPHVLPAQDFHDQEGIGGLLTQVGAVASFRPVCKMTAAVKHRCATRPNRKPAVPAALSN
jgi:hypothetical protein